ncbi:unnamed protein product, partial [Amoebophrya sp. A120]
PNSVAARGRSRGHDHDQGRAGPKRQHQQFLPVKSEPPDDEEGGRSPGKSHERLRFVEAATATTARLSGRNQQEVRLRVGPLRVIVKKELSDVVVPETNTRSVGGGASSSSSRRTEENRGGQEGRGVAEDFRAGEVEPFSKRDHHHGGGHPLAQRPAPVMEGDARVSTSRNLQEEETAAARPTVGSTGEGDRTEEQEDAAGEDAAPPEPEDSDADHATESETEEGAGDETDEEVEDEDVDQPAPARTIHSHLHLHHPHLNPERCRSFLYGPPEVREANRRTQKFTEAAHDEEQQLRIEQQQGAPGEPGQDFSARAGAGQHLRGEHP